jgi:hypothetical protein
MSSDQTSPPSQARPRISDGGGPPEREVLALSQALWIELKDPSVFGAATRPAGNDQ